MKFAKSFAGFGKFARTLMFTSPLLVYQLNNRSMQCTETHYEFYRKFTLQELAQFSEKYPNLHLIENKYVDHILTHLRDKNTNTKNFRVYANRLIRIIVEYALAISEKQQICKLSPLGYYEADELANQDDDYCIVPILRSGNAFLNEMLDILPGASVAQILIQRDEATAEAHLFYSKLPKDINKKKIFLVDPMLATGGSVIKAIEVLKENGVNEKDIVFLNIVSCETGLQNLTRAHPLVKVVTASIDYTLLPDSKYIAPGIGDFGDRYFGTQH